MLNHNEDKIFIEKPDKIRFIVQHPIGIGKVINKLQEEFKVTILKGEGETVILVEEKDKKVE